jgi:hypothetical protein
VKPQFDEAAILALERPDRALWMYYLLKLLVIPPLFPIFILPVYSVTTQCAIVSLPKAYP